MLNITASVSYQQAWHKPQMKTLYYYTTNVHAHIHLRTDMIEEGKLLQLSAGQ